MSDAVNHQGDLSAITISVLIVDDDEAHAQAVADCLRPIDCECTIAGSGQRALSLIESENFDIVITDLQLNAADALAVPSKARQEPLSRG